MSRIRLVPEEKSLIGSIWIRKEPVGDAWDEIRLSGLFFLGNDHPGGAVEACVTPVSFGPTVTASAESICESYTLKEHAEASARLAETLARAAVIG